MSTPAKNGKNYSARQPRSGVKMKRKTDLLPIVEANQQYLTVQADVFDSGLAREIGMNALGLWLAIKKHADYNTGECWPGQRKLVELTGLSSKTVVTGIKTLVDARLLRVVEEGGGKRSARYIARERLDVYLYRRRLCTVVVDYIPSRFMNAFQEALEGIHDALRGEGSISPTQCEIIPGEGFEWDAASGMARAVLDLPTLPVPVEKPGKETP
jgi:hypothetical protein